MGYAVWMYLPRHYIAITKLSVGIDYNRTGKLDDLEEDRLLGITEDIIHSDTVMNAVYLAQSSATDYRSFFRQTAITRTNQTWSLMISGKNPEELGKAAVLWLDTAAEALRAALEHAVFAEALLNELEGLTRCVQDSTSAVMTSGCPDKREDLHLHISELSEQISEELRLSCGLSTAIRLGPQNPDQLQIRPASRGAAADTLIGALIGLLAAFAIVWLPERNDPE